MQISAELQSRHSHCTALEDGWRPPLAKREIPAPICNINKQQESNSVYFGKIISKIIHFIQEKAAGIEMAKKK